MTPGYFAASGTMLWSGRFFTDLDRVGTAILSESLARRLWPGEALSNAVGRQVRQGDQRAPLVEVVGVVADVRGGVVEKDLLPQIYRPYLPPRTDGRIQWLPRLKNASAPDPRRLNCPPGPRATVRDLRGWPDLDTGRMTLLR